MRGVSGNANIMPGSVNSYLFYAYLDMSIHLGTDAARTNITPIISSRNPPKWQHGQLLDRFCTSSHTCPRESHSPGEFSAILNSHEFSYTIVNNPGYLSWTSRRRQVGFEPPIEHCLVSDGAQIEPAFFSGMLRIS